MPKVPPDPVEILKEPKVITLLVLSHPGPGHQGQAKKYRNEQKNDELIDSIIEDIPVHLYFL